MSENNSLPKQTATKAHVTALAMLAFGIILAVLGVNDVAPDQLASDINELGQAILTIVVPSIVAWVATYMTPNKAKS